LGGCTETKPVGGTDSPFQSTRFGGRERIQWESGLEISCNGRKKPCPRTIIGKDEGCANGIELSFVECNSLYLQRRNGMRVTEPGGEGQGGS